MGGPSLIYTDIYQVILFVEAETKLRKVLENTVTHCLTSGRVIHSTTHGSS